MIDTDNITYRETNGLSASQADWDEIEKILASRGWMSLNRSTTPHIALVEDEIGIAGFSIVQLIPHFGPLWVLPKLRGTQIPSDLVSRTRYWLTSVNARGIVVVADSPFTAKMCENADMTKIEAPVYVIKGAKL